MMKIKSVKLLAIILIAMAAVFALSACGKSGKRFDNILPTIEITSYEGWTPEDVPANVDTLTHSYSFQQRIYWHASDPDGVIKGYAFRVLDEDNNPVAVPGYDFIDADGSLTPQDLQQKYGVGWAIHYMPGADQNFALDNPNARRTIWTSQKYALINFPAADAFGEPVKRISKFEVVAIDNRGGISDKAWKQYRTESARPTCSVSTTKGNPAGDAVGSGLKLSFTMKDFDPFIAAIPYKFEFKIMKLYVDSSGNTDGEIIPGTESDWFNTYDQESISEYQLTRHTTPALVYDYENGTAISMTQVIARATDLAGVISEESETTPLRFKVKPGFYPHTQIYSKRLLTMGNFHYENWQDDTTPEVLPSNTVEGEMRYATSFFRNSDGKYTAVHSPNLKTYVRWGWYGEYGTVSANGTSFDYDDPYGKKVDVVLDRATRGNYFSEIIAFDLRFDGQPYYFGPYDKPEYKQTDEDGTVWLRLPVDSPLMQSVVLTGAQMDVGEHIFEVRCVDLQYEVDPVPAVIEYEVVPYIAPSARHGILLIDDDLNHPTNSPDSLVTAKYANMVGDYASQTTVLVRSAGGNTYPDVRRRQLAFSELMQYKTVIYHSDNPGEKGNLHLEPDGFALYLRMGGNMVFSHTQLLASLLSEISKGGVRTLMLRMMGAPDQPRMSTVTTGGLQINPFMQYAEGMQGYPRLDVEYGDPASFNPLVQQRHGLSGVSYFNELGTGTPIYTLGCKPVDYAAFPPTQDQYNRFHGKTIGIRNETPAGGKVFTFAFPLSYMKDEGTKALMNKILAEMM